MDLSQLVQQSRQLHSEIESIGQAQLLLSKKQKGLKKRKAILKKEIDKNLNKQAAIWKLNKKIYGEVEKPIIEGLSPIEDYFYNPNRTLLEIADKHNIDFTSLSRSLTKTLYRD